MAVARASGRRAIVVVAGLAAAAAVAAVLAGSAQARSLRSAVATDVSANWAGYVVSGESTAYTSVTGTWRQPTVSCAANDAGAASAFWVGLGGYFTGSQALEQVGTSADCDSATGKPSYYAWYELVPSAAVTIKKLKIAPGDLITTSVNVVGGNSVVLQVKNRSHGTSFTTTLPFANPDLTSAEWVAEAPASCSRYRCSQISLSNFGSVQFTRIAALGNTLGGTLTANPGWTTTAITLTPDGGRGFFPGPDRFAPAAVSTAGASPTAPSSDGRGFSVSWTANAGTS